MLFALKTKLVLTFWFFILLVLENCLLHDTILDFSLWLRIGVNPADNNRFRSHTRKSLLFWKTKNKTISWFMDGKVQSYNIQSYANKLFNFIMENVFKLQLCTFLFENFTSVYKICVYFFLIAFVNGFQFCCYSSAGQEGTIQI